LAAEAVKEKAGGFAVLQLELNMSNLYVPDRNITNTSWWLNKRTDVKNLRKNYETPVPDITLALARAHLKSFL